MRITAKFSSVCAKCNGKISAGEQIEWIKGNPSLHASCHTENMRMNGKSDNYDKHRDENRGWK